MPYGMCLVSISLFLWCFLFFPLETRSVSYIKKGKCPSFVVDFNSILGQEKSLTFFAFSSKMAIWENSQKRPILGQIRLFLAIFACFSAKIALKWAILDNISLKITQNQWFFHDFSPFLPKKEWFFHQKWPNSRFGEEKSKTMRDKNGILLGL